MKFHQGVFWEQNLQLLLMDWISATVYKDAIKEDTLVFGLINWIDAIFIDGGKAGLEVQDLEEWQENEEFHFVLVEFKLRYLSRDLKQDWE